MGGVRREDSVRIGHPETIPQSHERIVAKPEIVAFAFPPGWSTPPPEMATGTLKPQFLNRAARLMSGFGQSYRRSAMMED
jgi:hypothetical protein